jgi:hypothetical protein
MLKLNKLNKLFQLLGLINKKNEFTIDKTNNEYVQVFKSYRSTKPIGSI